MKKLLEVKQEIGTISKNATNPFFKKEYMDLNQLLTEIEPILISKGLLLTQPIENNCVVSRIVDTETGDMIESSLPLLTFTDAQKVGSCITYYRRYTLKSLLAIAEEDSDGNDITQAKPAKKKLTNINAACKAISEKTVTIKQLEAKYDLTSNELIELKSYES